MPDPAFQARIPWGSLADPARIPTSDLSLCSQAVATFLHERLKPHKELPAQSFDSIVGIAARRAPRFSFLTWRRSACALALARAFGAISLQPRASEGYGC